MLGIKAHTKQKLLYDKTSLVKSVVKDLSKYLSTRQDMIQLFKILLPPPSQSSSNLYVAFHSRLVDWS